jgi:hypothetical protein
MCQSTQKSSEDIYAEATALLGRDFEVDRTKDGKYIVLYMNFNSPPPPKGESELDAVERFITWFKDRKDIGLPELEESNSAEGFSEDKMPVRTEDVQDKS